jgi:hypothetical protein
MARGTSDWRALRQEARQQYRFAGSRVQIKPIAGDLRKMASFQFGIYLYGRTWSSTLKRIAAAGVALVMPRPAMYEDLTSYLLDSCENCTYKFNMNSPDLCRELNDLVLRTTDNDARARAAISTQLVMREMSLDSVEAYMFHTLKRISRNQNLTRLTPVELEAVGFERVTCNFLKNSYKGVLDRGLVWQLEEWADNNTCAFKDTRYLGSVPI